MMVIKRLSVTAFGLILLVTFLAPVCADFPDSNNGPGWYEGVWKVTVKQKCRDQDGKKFTIKKRTFYRNMTPAGGSQFAGLLHTDKAVMTAPVGNIDATFPGVPDPNDEVFFCQGFLHLHEQSSQDTSVSDRRIPP
jgi:hypothetical protein